MATKKVEWIDSEAGQKRISEEVNDRVDDLMSAFEDQQPAVAPKQPSTPGLVYVMLLVLAITSIMAAGTATELAKLKTSIKGLSDEIRHVGTAEIVLEGVMASIIAPTVPVPVTHNLVIRATTPCWIRASEGDHTLYEGTVKKGWTMGFEEAFVTVRSGCPGFIEYEKDGLKVAEFTNIDKHPEDVEVTQWNLR